MDYGGIAVRVLFLSRFFLSTYLEDPEFLVSKDPHPDEERAADESQSPEVSANDESPEEAGSPDSVPESATEDSESDASVAEDSESTVESSEDEGLPEWIPLTPELVEDEAIRGDFMLRWSVVLLAGLFACRAVSQTESLVHVKTGQYLASHGFLPPSQDVFSYTATEHSWVNLEWLYDLLVAGAYAVTGPAGLSVLAALLGAATFFLVTHTSRENLSTWWGSVSAAVALVACYPLFTALPEAVTLVGIAIVLWLLNDWSQSESSQRIWWLVPLMFLWCNMDQRAFLGPLLLILYGLGELADVRLGRAGFADQSQRKQFWLVTAACLGAMLLNPFGWNSWLSPLTLYGTEYPVLREYYSANPTLRELQCFPLYSETFWAQWDHHVVAGLAVIAFAAAAMVLNRQNLRLAHVLVLLGFGGLGVIASHELAAACLVATVVGTLNAQDWYRETFRQTYSIETMELLWTRGGRAVTVVAFFTLAFLGLNGTVMSSYDYRAGFGFSRGMQNLIDGYETELADAFDDRPFTFRLRQGDLLIWTGRKPFIDSRIAVYAGQGDSDILTLHDKTRYALRKVTGGSPVLPTSPKIAWLGQPDIWKATFDRFGVTHVVPRLSGEKPDYVTYFDLLASPDSWQLTRLGAVTAIFHRSGTDDAGLKKYLEEHRVSFVTDAFRDSKVSAITRRDWPRPPSIYDKYLIPPESDLPNSVQRARHLLAYVDASTNQRVMLTDGHAAAILYLAVRELHAATAESPSDAQAYRYLGRAYEMLGMLESRVAASANRDYSPQLRYYQSICAYNQALIAAPDDVSSCVRLAYLYLDYGRVDLALRALDQFDGLTANEANLSGPALDLKVRAFQYHDELNQRLTQFREGLAKAREKSEDVLPLAQQAYQLGFVLEAINLLEEDRYFVVQNVGAQLLHAVLLLEAGRLQEASDIVQAFSGAGSQWDLAPLKQAFSFVHAACGDFRQAVDVLTQIQHAKERQTAESLLGTLPFVPPPPVFAKQARNGWPTLQAVTVANYLYRFPEDLQQLLWLLAQYELEAGRVDEATQAMRTILESNPETSLRPLTCFYLYLTTDERIDLLPPSEWIPAGPDLFETEP